MGLTVDRTQQSRELQILPAYATGFRHPLKKPSAKMKNAFCWSVLGKERNVKLHSYSDFLNLSLHFPAMLKCVKITSLKSLENQSANANVM